MANLSAEAQAAAATVYHQKGKSLDEIEKEFPQLKDGVAQLRRAEKPKGRRGRGSGPTEPIRSARPKF